MTPKEVKDLAIRAVRDNDEHSAMMVCEEIVENDLYINVPKPTPTQDGRLIVSRWGNRPCKCGCGNIIAPGTKVWWEPNWGISIPEHIGKHVS